MRKASRKSTRTYHLGIRETNIETEKLTMKLKEVASEVGEATEYNQVIQGVLVRYVEILRDGYLFYVTYKNKDYIYTVPDIKLTANITLQFKRQIDRMLEETKNARR